MFHSKNLLFENLCKHSNWTVNEEPHATGLNIGDSFNISVDNSKDDTQSTLQVPIPEEPPSGLVVNYLNIVKFEHIDSARTQPSTTSSFSCEYCGEEFQMKAHLIQHVYVNHRDLEYPVKTEQPEQSANQPEHQSSIRIQSGRQSFNQPGQPSIKPEQSFDQHKHSFNQPKQSSTQPELTLNRPEQSSIQLEQPSNHPEQSVNQPGQSFNPHEQSVNEQSSIQPQKPSNQPEQPNEVAVNSSEHSFIETGRSINQSDQSTRPMIRVKRRKLSEHDDKIPRPYSGEGYKCVECNECFPSKQHLIQHRQSHGEGTPHKCSECKKSFKSKISLSEHMETHSDGYQGYKCPECNKCFPHKRSLIIHRESHGEGAPHKCPNCEKSFKWKISLTRHIKIHNDDHEVYRCLKCDKCFPFKHYLTRHLRSHTEGNLHKCSECARSFKTEQGLFYHIKAHAAKALQEKFRCTSCVKLFTSRFRLAEHQCHACLSCENVFCSQKMLEYHLWRQHYTTMLPCSECEKRFQRYTTLNSHMRRHRIEQKYFKLSPTNDSSSTRNDQI
eukprot:928858_1